MTWKTERWLDEVFPGESQIYSEYRTLSPRELAIVAAAVLDVALAELLVLRLGPYDKEAQEFLGLNGDGRAPTGTFGSRIQLGLLIGLLTPEDTSILRVIKELRNLFAHPVNMSFLSASTVKAALKLHSLWVKRWKGLVKTGVLGGTSEQLKELAHHLPHVAEAGEGLLLTVFAVYHAYFHRMHSRIERIGDACR